MSARAESARSVAQRLEMVANEMNAAEADRRAGVPIPRGEMEMLRGAVESALASYVVVAEDADAIREAQIIHASVCEEHDHGVAEVRVWAASLRQRAERWDAEDASGREGAEHV